MFDLIHGVVKLDHLYLFAERNPDIPHRTKDKPIYSAYREKVKSLLVAVSENGGWYCWFRESDRQLFYIGQSSKGKTSSLKARLREELWEEYIAFWSTKYDANKMIATLVLKYNGKYKANIKRASQKAGADRIVWISLSAVTRGELDVVEQKLISELSPSANKVKKDYSKVSVEVYPYIEDLIKRYIH